MKLKNTALGEWLAFAVSIIIGLTLTAALIFGSEQRRKRDQKKLLTKLTSNNYIDMIDRTKEDLTIIPGLNDTTNPIDYGQKSQNFIGPQEIIEPQACAKIKEQSNLQQNGQEISQEQAKPQSQPQPQPQAQAQQLPSSENYNLNLQTKPEESKINYAGDDIFLEQNKNLFRDQAAINEQTNQNERNLFKEKRTFYEQNFINEQNFIKEQNLRYQKSILNEQNFLKEQKLLKEKNFIKQEKLLKELNDLREQNNRKEKEIIKIQNLLKDHDIAETKNLIKEQDLLKEYNILKERNLLKKLDIMKEQKNIKEKNLNLLKERNSIAELDFHKERNLLEEQNKIKEESFQKEQDLKKEHEIKTKLLEKHNHLTEQNIIDEKNNSLMEQKLLNEQALNKAQEQEQSHKVPEDKNILKDQLKNDQVKKDEKSKENLQIPLETKGADLDIPNQQQLPAGKPVLEPQTIETNQISVPEITNTNSEPIAKTIPTPINNTIPNSTVLEPKPEPEELSLSSNQQQVPQPELKSEPQPKPDLGLEQSPEIIQPKSEQIISPDMVPKPSSELPKESKPDSELEIKTEPESKEVQQSVPPISELTESKIAMDFSKPYPIQLPVLKQESLADRETVGGQLPLQEPDLKQDEPVYSQVPMPESAPFEAPAQKPKGKVIFDPVPGLFPSILVDRVLKDRTVEVIIHGPNSSSRKYFF